MGKHTLSNNNYDLDDECYPRSFEELAEECPSCKSNKMVKYMEADGPDDYRYVYECKNCGCTQTE